MKAIDARFVEAQLDMCVDRIKRFASEEVALAMGRYVDDLRTRALALNEREDGLHHGSDYVIVAAAM